MMLPTMTARFHRMIDNPSAPDGRVAMWEMARQEDGETVLSVAVAADRNHLPPLIARACNTQEKLIEAAEELLKRLDERYGASGIVGTTKLAIAAAGLRHALAKAKGEE